ncbi:MAG: PQQ-binding-like beta-propeller repeat protein [Ignavibacteriales bacterium]|nr:PQQ-binding-like beta-propeller repeat protein [Ignavibacteriales bacterium]
MISRRSLVNVVVFLLTVFVFTGCSGIRLNRSIIARQGDWAMFGGDPSRSNTVMTGAQPPFEVVWEYNAQGGLRATPLVRDSMIIVSTLHGEIQVVSVQTGKRLGYRVFDAPVVGTPVLDGSRVLFALSGRDKTLIALDLSTGERVWGISAGPIESSLLLVDRFLYATTLTGEALCVDKTTGDEVWRYDSAVKGKREAIRSSPATDGTVLCFGSDDHSVYGLDRSRGHLLWKTPTGASVFASPLMINGMAIVGNLAGAVHAFDAATGRIRWTYETGSKVYLSASGSRETVFVGSADGVLHALDPSTGEPRWKFRTGGIIGATPLVAGNLVYVGSMNKRLHALDVVTGKERWNYEAEGRIRVSPVLWGDYLLVTSEDKYITALRTLGP